MGGLLALSCGCGREEGNRIVLRYNEIAHVDGCNIRLIQITIRDHGDEPFAALNYNCGGLPESDLFDKNWSKNYLPPLGFTMNVGDCQLFHEKFYCVQAIEHDKVTFVSTYKWGNPDHSRIERIKSPL